MSTGQTSIGVWISPDPVDTVLRLHQPTILPDGRAVHIVPYVVGDDGATIQFSSPQDARAWLYHCLDLLDAGIDAQNTAAAL